MIGIILAGLVPFIVITTIWFTRSNLTIEPRLLINLIESLALIAGLCACCAAFLWRVDRVPAFNKRWLVATVSTVKHLTAAKIMMIVFAAALTIFSYLATATDWPLMDAYLARADSAFGFNAIGMVSAINEHPLLPRLLKISYDSLIYQSIAIPIVLAVFAPPARLYEFVALFCVSGLMACVGMAFVPAAGTVDFYQPADNIRGYFGEGATGYLPTLHALRSLAPYQITQLYGLVTFPSFHTVLAVIFTYVSRGRWYVLLPMIALNVLLIVGTIPEGGHYLIDVIAGALIAVASIYAVRFFATKRLTQLANPLPSTTANCL